MRREPLLVNILLVDDFDETLEALRLQYGTYPDAIVVGSAHNGEEMWRNLIEQVVDIVSIDIQLGHENGFALCEQVRLKYPDLFIIICSMEASETNRERAEQAGASYFLAKPLARPDVHQVIEFYKDSLHNKHGSRASDDWGDELLKTLQ